MKIATYRWGGRRHVGQIVGQGAPSSVPPGGPDGAEIVPLALPDAARVQDVGALALIEHLAAGRAFPGTAGARLPLSAVELEAPLPKPRRNVFCVGRNYRAHAAELADTIFRGDPQLAKAPIDQWPMIFTKVPECVVAPGAVVRMPRGQGGAISEQIDYEAELAVVIGRGGVNISRARAMEHVWGYTIVNDVTARDVQQRHNQWHLGKSFDTFCPMGPWLVDSNEVDGRRTRVRCWVNGELRQDAPTTDLIFDIPTLIETISRGITLYPGDVIATGTPAGVGMGMKPPVWLKSGDRMRIEIDGIGVLENPVE